MVVRHFVKKKKMFKNLQSFWRSTQNDLISVLWFIPFITFQNLLNSCKNTQRVENLATDTEAIFKEILQHFKGYFLFGVPHKITSFQFYFLTVAKLTNAVENSVTEIITIDNILTRKPFIQQNKRDLQNLSVIFFLAISLKIASIQFYFIVLRFITF